MSTFDDNPQTGLREYALLVWGRKFIVIVVALILIGGTLAYSAVTTPKYRATATLLLTPTLNPTLLEANGGLSANLIVDVPSDTQVIESLTVQNIVAKQIPNVPAVAVAQVGTTDVVTVAVEDTNASRAAQAATAYARAYISYEQGQTLNSLTSGSKLLQKHIDTVQLLIANLENKISTTTSAGAASGLQTQLQSANQENAALENQLANYQFFSTNGTTSESGQVISIAQVPLKPTSPKTVEWTVIAGILGILLGVGLAMLLEALSDKSRPSPTASVATR